MKYAIFGATGAVGKELAPILASTKEKFRVVGRSEQSLRKTFQKYEPYVEYCVADLTKPEEAEKAAKDVETLFYVVGVPYNRFELHPQITKVCTDAAAKAGVKNYVHLGTLYSFGRMQGDRIGESHPRTPHTFKGRMRKEQEDIVLSAHEKDGMRVTILRAPDFYGGDSELSHVHLVFKAALEGKTADVIGPIDKPHEFVFVPDLARTLFQISQKSDAFGKTWNLGGVGYLSVRELSEKIFAKVGAKPKLRVANKFILRIVGLFNPIMKEFVEMDYLMSEPLFVDDSAIRALIPELTKTSYDEGIGLTLKFMKAKN